MTPEKELAFHNAVAANGGLISDKIREEFEIEKPSAVEGDDAPKPIIEIPEGFADLPWKELQSLVKEVTGAGPENKADAIAQLTLEVERRAADAETDGHGEDNGGA